MRSLFAGLVLLTATSADTASAEILYPWCRQPADGGNFCGYSSFQQCLGESTGKGAFCIQNPQYQGPAGASKPAGAAATGKRRGRSS